MAEPFLGQIVLYSCNFPPRNYAMCQGQLMAIQQNSALFSLLGTYYGGNGTSNFGLPDLRGRVPLGMGQGNGLSGYVIGEMTGTTTTTITSSTLAQHNHTFNASLNATTTQTSGGNTLGKADTGNPVKGFTKGLMYSPGQPRTMMSQQALTATGGSTAHNNMQPFLALNYCIALSGVYPTRN